MADTEDPLLKMMGAIGSNGVSTSNPNDAAYRMLSSLVPLRDALERGSVADSFGDFEQFLYGSISKPADEVTGRERLARAAGNLLTGGQLSKNIADRSNIASIPFEQMSKSLEGQGSVSNIERQMAARAFTNINDGNTPKDVAQQDINRLIEFYEMGMFRNNNGIAFDPATGEEYQTDPATGTRQRGITYYDENGNKAFMPLQDTDPKVTVIPQWYNDDTAQVFIKNLGPDEVIFYNGQIMRAGQAQ